MRVDLFNYGVLQIELTDLCNLSCRMCTPQVTAAGKVHGISGGFINPTVFKKIFEGDSCFDHVILQWMGDPALHPELPELVGIAARSLKNRSKYLRIDTNALALTPAKADLMIEQWLEADSLPLLIVFSLDAATKDTYKAVKGRDAFDEVMSNIRHVLDRRKKNLLPLNIQAQMVVQEGNSHEVGLFVEYWRRLFMCRGSGSGHSEILLKRLSVAAGGIGQSKADALYQQAIKQAQIEPSEKPIKISLWEQRPWEKDDSHQSVKRKPCPGPWMTPVVRFDGEVTVCCVDLKGNLALGNIKKASFDEIMKRADKIKLAHITGDLSQYPLCQSCGGINWYYMEDQDVYRWLLDNGYEQYWFDYVKAHAKV